MGGARARCPTLRDSKTRGKWTFTRARGELCANRPQVVQGTCAPTGAARLCPPDALRVIRGRSSGSGETRATELPKPSAAVFAQVRLAANLHPCQSIASRLAIARGICARFPASGGRRPLNWDIAPAGRGGPMARVSGGAGRGESEAVSLNVTWRTLQETASQSSFAASGATPRRAPCKLPRSNKPFERGRFSPRA